MARKAAWEDASDLGPYGKSRSTSWGRVFILLLLVGIGTFVGAYYMPLYRAQQKLAEQYRGLSQQSQSLTESAQKAQSDLKSVTADRDALRAEHDRRESAKKGEGDQLERVRADLSIKLDKFLKKGSAILAPNGGSLLVALDGAVLFVPQKLDFSLAGKAALCDVAKGAQGFSVRVSGSLAEDATVPPGLAASFANPWALSAARAAAVTQLFEDKCGFAGGQLNATGNGKHEPLQAQLASLKAPERIVIELRSR